jgi:hypothetical protein
VEAYVSFLRPLVKREARLILKLPQARGGVARRKAACCTKRGKISYDASTTHRDGTHHMGRYTAHANAFLLLRSAAMPLDAGRLSQNDIVAAYRVVRRNHVGRACVFFDSVSTSDFHFDSRCYPPAVRRLLEDRNGDEKEGRDCIFASGKELAKKCVARLCTRFCTSCPRRSIISISKAH